MYRLYNDLLYIYTYIYIKDLIFIMVYALHS